ncbi:MAG TPA: alpha-glucan family phosphorylase [Elusimicrobiota bacterium]|jgi:starch phosphorylase|nr:alpha-glucan family phosphorylase [Elusimicrobiota bacterium]
MNDNPTIRLPKRVARLSDVAYNLWWCWNPGARALFKQVDRNLWSETNHNPVRLLAQCRPERLEAIAKDPLFLQRYDSLVADFDEYMAAAKTWFKAKHPNHRGAVAYFSAEFGVHNSLPIYSGGLGILAGDHCKSASDLGVPLVGVGFMYPQGYVQQRIGIDGWQQNYYEYIDWNTAPVQPARLPDGSPCVFKLELGGWSLHVKVWRAQVGRVPLYLMDTNVEENQPGDREISGRLYGGDKVMRLRQEIVLGIGGVRILKALGVDAQVYHANEGHASFLLIERIRERVQQGKSFEDAAREVAETSVFTTHTPVPAGHDVFPKELIDQYFRGFWPSLGMDLERFMALAQEPGEEGWNMTVLALRLAGRINGVSRRNGEVSRQMWLKLWPERTVDQVPISHVTNGIHLPTWLSQGMSDVYDRHLGPEWKNRQNDAQLWSKISEVPDEVIWSTHMKSKRELTQMVRAKATGRWMRDRIDATQVLAGGALLDPEALTIGFARRFAGYKRATLILSDLERLRKILMDLWRPVQIVFAGKAHPADDSGKNLISQVYKLAHDPAFGGRIAFVEDYDMHKARYLVQGCDLWLNNPLAPLEACGTSGQKAASNGVPNLSILDGWWEEGYNRENGWAPASTVHVAPEERDKADAKSLYDLLEEKIVPLYYDRGANQVPAGWVQVMKNAIRTTAPVFCSDRMVQDYVNQLYVSREAHQRSPVAAR